MDVAYVKPSSGTSSLVETPHTLTNPRTLKQIQREKKSLCYDQNKNTTSDSKNISKSNRIAATAQTNSIEDRNNINKITHSKNTSDINISERDDGIRVK